MPALFTAVSKSKGTSNTTFKILQRPESPFWFHWNEIATSAAPRASKVFPRLAPGNGLTKWWTLKKQLCLQALLWSEGSILASSHLQLPSTESHLSIFLLHLLHALCPPQLVNRWALEEAAHYFCSSLALTRYLSKVYRFIACGIFLTWFHDPTIWRRIDEKMLKNHGKISVGLWKLLPNADLMCRFRALSLGFFLPCAWAWKTGRLWNKRTQTKYKYVQCT